MFVASENGLQWVWLEIPLLGPQSMHFRPAVVSFLPCYTFWDCTFALANLWLSSPTVTTPIRTVYLDMIFWLLL